MTLWCLSTIPHQSQKHKCDGNQGSDDKAQVQASKQLRSSQGSFTDEERKAKAKEYELMLVELHKNKWTSFQYNL